MQIHIVQRGETLWGIASFFGMSLSQIIQANQIANPNRLVIGQALVIPTPPGSHIIRAGETLWMIAENYATTPQILASDNNIANPSRIYPGQVLYIRRPSIDVNGYLSRTDSVGRQALLQHGDELSSVSLSSYHVSADGSITPVQIIANQYVSTMVDIHAIADAYVKQVKPVMVITNFIGTRFNADLAHTILSNQTVQNTLITNIIATMKNKGYLELNVDFEVVPPQDRNLFSQFIRRLASALHNEGYPVTIALSVKTEENTTSLLSGAEDYAVLGQLADYVMLMTYGWGYMGGPPYPIAPINEIRKVLDYAVSVIPRSKIMMGVPLYAYDWKLPFQSGTFADMISPQDAVSRAQNYGASIQYNYLYQTPYFRYTDGNGVTHEVWFEDTRSVLAKYETVKKYGLRGVSFWAISFSFPQNWYVLNDVFRVKKF